MKCSIKSCQSEATSWSKLKPFCSKHSPFQKHRPKKIGAYVRHQKMKNKTHSFAPCIETRGHIQTKVEVEDEL